jgi:NAD(P)-dependent dehydrogenase (short-subunit alcohol dehydrogenase family)
VEYREDRATKRFSFLTGAASGIGQRIAVGPAEAGASVACFDLESSKRLEKTAEQIREFGRQALVVRGNVTRASDLRDRRCRERTGQNPLVGIREDGQLS